MQNLWLLYFQEIFWTPLSFGKFPFGFIVEKGHFEETFTSVTGGPTVMYNIFYFLKYPKCVLNNLHNYGSQFMHHFERNSPLCLLFYPLQSCKVAICKQLTASTQCFVVHFGSQDTKNEEEKEIIMWNSTL